MNIQELSVGDLVATDIAQLTVEGDDLTNAFVEQTQKPISIISLLGEDELIFAKIDDELMGGYGTIYLKAENTSPIPLTPEILEKNGFKLFTEEHYGFIPDIEHPDTWICDIKDTIKNNDVRIWMFEQSNNWCFHCINHGIGSSNNLGKAYITDVHELQHCLRLAKIDKEIVL